MHVEDKIEVRRKAVRIFRQSYHQLASEKAVSPVGGFVGKIELGCEHWPLGSLHFDMIVAGATRIERRQDSAEAIATLTIGEEVSAIAEAGIVVFALLISMPEVDQRSLDRAARAG